MAEQRDLPSDSDDSDVDFKPEDEESLPSEEDSDGSVEETPLDQGEEENTVGPGKRKKKQTKRRKRTKKKKIDISETTDETAESEEVKKLSAEEEKKKADSLWSDFMKDCTPPVRKTTSSSTDLKAEVKETKPAVTQSSLIEKENKAVVTQIFEFAGEKISVEKEVPAQGSGRGRGRGVVGGGAVRGRAGGLAAIVGQLGKKNKLSTLEKSKLDWDRFKKDEGIEEEIQTHNKGKDGYLEKQDFLQRTDLRQFEIEKQLRTTSRSNR